MQTNSRKNLVHNIPSCNHTASIHLPSYYTMSFTEERDYFQNFIWLANNRPTFFTKHTKSGSFVHFFSHYLTTISWEPVKLQWFAFLGRQNYWKRMNLQALGPNNSHKKENISGVNFNFCFLTWNAFVFVLNVWMFPQKPTIKRMVNFYGFLRNSQILSFLKREDCLQHGYKICKVFLNNFQKHIFMGISDLFLGNFWLIISEVVNIAKSK